MSCSSCLIPRLGSLILRVPGSPRARNSAISPLQTPSSDLQNPLPDLNGRAQNQAQMDFDWNKRSRIGVCGGVAEEEDRGEEGLRKCLAGCKAKATPSTRFCNTRILSDSRQISLQTLSYTGSFQHAAAGCLSFACKNLLTVETQLTTSPSPKNMKLKVFTAKDNWKWTGKIGRRVISAHAVAFNSKYTYWLDILKKLIFQTAVAVHSLNLSAGEHKLAAFNGLDRSAAVFMIVKPQSSGWLLRAGN
uniref:Uncharacterized protein n=1 Tax=Salix viminalis TaxID=40686 RepID=A0A6N2LRJ0_SALVM